MAAAVCAGGLPAHGAPAVVPFHLASVRAVHDVDFDFRDDGSGGSGRPSASVASPLVGTALSPALGQSLGTAAETAPEPGSLVLLGTALLAVPALRRILGRSAR